MEDNVAEPWGAEMSEENFEISMIRENMQFARKGIQKGWRIHMVNKMSTTSTQDKEKILPMLQSGKKCVIQFAKKVI